MNYKQTLLASLLLALMAVVGLPAFAQNKDQQPIITFHTTVYDENNCLLYTSDAADEL